MKPNPIDVYVACPHTNRWAQCNQKLVLRRTILLIAPGWLWWQRTFSQCIYVSFNVPPHTSGVYQSDCFVTHWEREMRFLHWWSFFDTVYFGPDKAFCRPQTDFSSSNFHYPKYHCRSVFVPDWAWILRRKKAGGGKFGWENRTQVSAIRAISIAVQIYYTQLEVHLNSVIQAGMGYLHACLVRSVQTEKWEIKMHRIKFSPASTPLILWTLERSGKSGSSTQP